MTNIYIHFIHSHLPLAWWIFKQSILDERERKKINNNEKYCLCSGTKKIFIYHRRSLSCTKATLAQWRMQICNKVFCGWKKKRKNIPPVHNDKQWQSRTEGIHTLPQGTIKQNIYLFAFSLLKRKIVNFSE